MIFDLFRWWLVVALLGWLALPLSSWFFARLPDRGYSFAKVFGILLVGYGAWLLSMLGLGAFGRVQLTVMALLLAGGGIALGGWRRALAVVRERPGWALFHELLFVGALWLGLEIRWHQFWGVGVGIETTEQPMDLTFLSGILASPQFPPQDPWLAPYPINYYYLGYLLIAALIRLSGVAVGVGYTLGIVTVFALAAVSIAGLVRNLIELSADEPGARHGTLGRWLFPLAGVLLVLVLGNQAAALQVLAGSEKVVALDPPQLASAVANGLGSGAVTELAPPFPADNFGNDARIDPSQPVPSTSLAWWSSRAVWDDLPNGDGTVRRVYNITEFPFFSFLLGDLHPHVLSLPWSLLAVAVTLNVLVRRRAPDFRARADLLRLLLTGIVLGGLYAINSWDLPTYVLLYAGALALLYLRLAGSLRRFFWPHYVQQLGATVLASYFLYLPFHMSFAAPTSGFPLGLAPARTGFVDFVIVFGLFAVPLVAMLVGRWTLVRRADAESGSLDRWLSAPIALGSLLLLLLVGIVIGWPLLALLPLAGWCLLVAYRRREQPAEVFALWIVAVGALVVAGVDVVYLRDWFETRMNTIFKFYYQVWLLWGTVAAYALWLLTRRLRPWSALWLALFVPLLLGASVYPLRAPAREAAERTLDGLAYLRRSQPDEAAVIDWLRANTRGDAVVLQAPGVAYRPDTARIASGSGRPTLLGWTQHERLWRSGQPQLEAQIAAREQDVATIYTTTDPALARSLLERYGVEYVLVGPQERALVEANTAPPEALGKFGSWMEPVFEQGAYTLYRRS